MGDLERSRIQKIKEIFSRIPGPKDFNGIGDDAAVFSAPAGELQIVTTDSLLEGVHFRREWMSASDLGYKSLAVNLSDLAAEGAKPLGFFLNLSLPPEITEDWFTEYNHGLFSIAKEFQIPLLGGDLTGSKQGIFISITALGSAPREKIKTRSGAKERDLIFVTGRLGDSAAGLDILSQKRDGFEGLKAVHLRPHPHLAESLFLREQMNVHSLMDVSDGLLLDLPKLADQSQRGFRVYLEKIPHSIQLLEYTQKFNLDPWQFSLAGGEDYVLLGTCDEPSAYELQRNFHKHFTKPLYFLGEIMPATDQHWLKEKKPIAPNYKSFSHF